MSIHLDPDALGSGVMQPGAALPSPLPAHPAAGGLASRRPGVLRQVAHGLGSFFRGSLLMGVLLVVGLFVLERFGPVEWRPSTFIGSFAGREQTASLLTSIEAKRAEVAMLKEEEARAQQEVIALQADNERVTAAYKALFDRGTMLAQAWANAAKEALMLEMQTRVAGLRGRTGVSSTKDTVAMLCDLGRVFSPDITCGDSLRESAREDRHAVSAEVVENFRQQSKAIAQSLNDWSQGLPDPAQVVAMKAKVDRLYPGPRAPVPSPPLGSPTVEPSKAAL